MNLKSLQEATRKVDTEFFECNKDLLEYHHIKNAGICLVFLNGLGVTMNSWFAVIGSLINNEIILYNRLGTGKSSKATEMQTPQIIIEQLLLLIRNKIGEKKFVLIAHSFGGFYAQILLKQKLESLLGVILIESSTLYDIKSKVPTGIDKNNEANFIENIEKMLQVDDSISEIPLSIIIGTKKRFGQANSKFLTRIENQKKLSNLSTNSKIYESKESTHFVQFDDPNIIIKCILDLLLIYNNKN
jgi:pimeloyl-ACP methyl ester carboxylesterase